MDNPGEIVITNCEYCEEEKPCRKVGPVHYEGNGEGHFEWAFSICDTCSSSDNTDTEEN